MAMPGDQSRINGRLGGRKKGYGAEGYRKALLNEISKNKKPLAKALIARGLAGDVPALKEINDRAFGKAPQDGNLNLQGNLPIFLPVEIMRKHQLGNPKDHAAK